MSEATAQGCRGKDWAIWRGKAAGGVTGERLTFVVAGLAGRRGTGTRFSTGQGFWATRRSVSWARHIYLSTNKERKTAPSSLINKQQTQGMAGRC